MSYPSSKANPFEIQMEPISTKNDSHIHEFTDPIPKGSAIRELAKGEALLAGLKRMDNTLTSTFAGDVGCCTRFAILQGQIGLCTYYGRTHFLPPGNYFRIGLGCTLHQVHNELDPTSSGQLLLWKDITYISMAENHVAVVQEGDRQLLLGSGRYLLRAPTTLYGDVDVQNLRNKMYCEAITESAAPPSGNGLPGADLQTKVKLEAGEWQKAGAITFVRAQPGFSWVIQNSTGDLRTGVGFTVARGGEVFKRFVDYQNYARTTRAFLLESQDRQEVRVRVQLRWRLVDAKTWVVRQGASVDIFDAIEEIAQSMLRDAIAGNTYEDCANQATKGYDGIEGVVRPRLAEETQLLGGILLGFEIRELRFPLLDLRNQNRAQQEAKLSEELLEQKRRLEIEAQENARRDAARQHENKMAREQIEHSTNMEILKEKQEVAKTTSAATVLKAKSESDIMLKTVQMKADNEAQIFKLKHEEEKIKAAQALKMMAFKQQIEEQTMQQQTAASVLVGKAKADADATLAKAQAEARAQLCLAEAEAKATDLIGKSYTQNVEFVKFKLAELQKDVAITRAQCLARAMDTNKGAMIPVDLQRELAVLESLGGGKNF
jgi:regulator of protease activity HflC (stomatin/prohibitin superfamily)